MEELAATVIGRMRRPQRKRQQRLDEFPIFRHWSSPLSFFDHPLPHRH
jgi:hypothetical protein